MERRAGHPLNSEESAMSSKIDPFGEPMTEPATSLLRRFFDFLDRMTAVGLVSANLMCLVFALTAGASQCASTAHFIDDPDQLAALGTAPTVECAVSPAIRGLVVLFGFNALYISGIFASQTPVHRKWRWLPRKKQQAAQANSPAAVPVMNGQASSQLTQ
jgi:hypothetical protein